MTPSTASPLETIPLSALEHICEYLDDYAEKRQSLWTFSLTSRSCYAAAAHQRLCQIQLKICDPIELESGLKRWSEILSPGGGHRHVRRLKVSWVMPEVQSLRGLQAQAEVAEVDKNEYDYDWYGRDSFDTHDFCHPSKVCREYSGERNQRDDPEVWLPFARFISQLPGLQDLVWAYSYYMPQSVLSAVHTVGCRLHMHYFRLDSLVQHRGSPKPVSADDYALAASPCLHSIVVGENNLETDGMLNYNNEAVMRMVSGVTPNLAHVWMLPSRAGASLALIEAVSLGMPLWGGFFQATADEQPMLGRLRSLDLISYDNDAIGKWSRVTDFTCLRNLTIPWELEHGVSLANMAVRGDFKSLDTLKVHDIVNETDRSQNALNRLLGNLKPLQRLYLDGYIGSEAFDIVLRCHGGNLRDLSILPYRGVESRNRLVVFSGAVIQQVAEQCPKLEQIWLYVNRTRGDDRETGIYRALSRVPRLRRAFLWLRYSFGPDEELWDEEIDGEYPILNSFSEEEIPHADIREIYSNSAIDDTLALSIFNLMSSGGSLTYLRLQPVLKDVGYGRQLFSTTFGNVLRWLNRLWVCKRDVQGRVAVCEPNRKERVCAEPDWKFLSMDEDELDYGLEMYRKLFNDIWPQRTPEWWNDWKSLPLT